MDRLKESPFTGMFILPSGKEVPGILNLAGSKSELKVWYEDEKSGPDDGLWPTMNSIEGFLSDK